MNADEAKQLSKRDTFKAIFSSRRVDKSDFELGRQILESKGFCLPKSRQQIIANLARNKRKNYFKR